MKLPLNTTAGDLRALFAKKHAEGAARVRAILASEAPPSRHKAAKDRAVRGVKPEHIKAAQDRCRELHEEARLQGSFAFRIDVRTPNPANMAKGSSRLALAALKKQQRGFANTLASFVLSEVSGLDLLLALEEGVTVILTRVAPSSGLDPHDGLPGALKACVDGVADALRLPNDRDRRVTWTYAQRRGFPGEHAVEVRILFSKPFTK